MDENEIKPVEQVCPEAQLPETPVAPETTEAQSAFADVETPAEETPAEEAVAEERLEESPAEETPAEETPAEETPVEESLEEETVAEEASGEDSSARTEVPQVKATGTKREKRRRAAAIILIFTLLMALTTGVLGFTYYSITKPVQTTGGVKVNSVLDLVTDLKANLLQLVDALKAKDFDTADACLANVDSDVAQIRVTLAKPQWRLVASLPVLNEYFDTADKLLNMADEASEEILHPVINQLRRYPLEYIKAGDGFNVNIVRLYLDFADEILPKVRALADELDSMDLSALDKEGKIPGYTAKLREYLAMYDGYADYIDIVRVLMGDGGDRLYVFAAQNSAEVRSCGGFPGSVGTIRVQNGVLTIGSFDSVYNVLSTHMSELDGSLWPTDTEDLLFGERMWMSHDAEFNPDFERVAEIWAAAYEYRKGERVDGVVSMTPSIVQDLLRFTDPIVLFDGTELNGDNATYELQLGIYRRYMYGDAFTAESPWITDQLFSEAAALTMKTFSSGFGVDHLQDYLGLVEQGFADRRIMLWLKDTEDQALVRKLGWSGGLNKDPLKPEIGVYYTLENSSKLGWWSDFNYELGDYVKNEDGSRTYNLTVSFQNTITAEEIRHYSSYVKGRVNGLIQAGIYIFAPYGGTLWDVTTDTYYHYRETNYENLQCVFYKGIFYGSGEGITIHLKVKTAPGVDMEPTFSATPTLNNYYKQQ